MRQKLKRIIAIGIMTTAGAIAFASPALAATLTYSGRQAVLPEGDSPSLEAHTRGRHTTMTLATCSTSGPQIELYQDFYFKPNTPLGRKPLNCGYRATSAWNSNSGGDHFLRFRSGAAGEALTVDYKWTYPG